MRRISLIAVISAVSTGLLVAAGVFPAQAAGGNGVMTTTISGVPSSLSVGGGFELTINIASTSPYRIHADDFYLGLWNSGQVGAAKPTGVDVQWDDPATGAWRSSDYVDGNGCTLRESSQNVWIEPHGSLAVHLRISMSSAAPSGTVHLTSIGAGSYSLWTTSGQNVAGALDNYNMAKANFRYGSSAPAPAPAPATHTAAPTPTHRATVAPTSAAPAPTPTSAPATTAAASPAPVPAPTSEAAVSPSPSPSATPSASPTTVALASTSGSGSGSGPYLAAAAGVAAIVVGAGAAGAVVWRRRRSAAAA